MRAVRAWGVVGTIEKLFKMRTLKFGKLVGTDQLGNRYYENTVEVRAGEARGAGPERAGTRPPLLQEPPLTALLPRRPRPRPRPRPPSLRPFRRAVPAPAAPLG